MRSFRSIPILSRNVHDISHDAIFRKQLLVSAKTHGWGWSLPTKWQGWLVLAAYVALVATGTILLARPERLVAFLAYMLAITGPLLAICWWNGAPPRWPWGAR